MSTDKLYIQKENGELAGSISTGGKHNTPTARISRQLHLGYPIQTTPEVDQYLALREKYDKAAKIWSDKENSLEVREAHRQEMLKNLEAVHELPVETVLTGWEIYEKGREDAGITVDDLPYPKTVVETLARSIQDGIVNPGSVEGFIPPRYKEFTLPTGQAGYDVSYEDYINGSHPDTSNYVLVGANIDLINLNVSAGLHKYHVQFRTGVEQAGFKDGEGSLLEGESSYWSSTSLESLKKDVEDRPRLIKIKSLRFIRKQAPVDTQEVKE